MANILIIDDDESLCRMMRRRLEYEGHEVTTSLTLEGGLRQGRSGAFDVVFLDVSLPDGNGLEALPLIQAFPSSPETIIFTGAGDPDGAEMAIKSGAWDYIEKPPSMEQLMLPLLRALQYRGERRKQRPKAALRREGIVGNSPQLAACLDRVAQAASSEANVLITGETGTGKELMARAIHKNGPRAERDFVVVDCAALPQTLVESTLFGHEKGAFTGADRGRAGLIERANGGTLFLDEVGELPLPLQKPFLRVLEERRFRPIGSNREVESDFRLLAATNKDLEGMMKTGQFRKDLFFRLKSFTLQVPPLREHMEDMEDLVTYHVSRLCSRYGAGTKGFSPEFLEALSVYEWPGNVRELINVLEGAVASALQEPTLFPNHLPEPLRIHRARSALSRRRGEPKDLEGHPAPRRGLLLPLKEFRKAAVAEAEKGYLQDLMDRTGGRVEEACRLSGLSRARLYALLKLYGVGRED